MAELESVSNNAISPQALLHAPHSADEYVHTAAQQAPHYYAGNSDAAVTTVEEGVGHNAEEEVHAESATSYRYHHGANNTHERFYITLQDCDEMPLNKFAPAHAEHAYGYLVPKEDVGDEVSTQTHGVFHVRGHSMVDEKISEGARVLICLNNKPQDGRISLVYRKHDDGCTLKLLVQQDARWYIQWRNGSGKQQALEVDDRVIGVYVQTLQRWHYDHS